MDELRYGGSTPHAPGCDLQKSNPTQPVGAQVSDNFTRDKSSFFHLVHAEFEAAGAQSAYRVRRPDVHGR